MIDAQARPDTKTCLSIILIFLGCFVFSLASQNARAGQEFHSPFEETDRRSFQAIHNRLVGSYGEYRSSYKPGHLHAGIDLEGAFGETVYAIGDGRVYRIYHEFPHRSVIVEHSLLDGKNLYSIYTHVQEIKVGVGDRVDERTALARLFDAEELKRADFGTPNHLHLEIRTSMADNGRASYASMSREELDKYCTDPMEFFKEHLEK
jgi:murein DD-endopeptidase MepM/ murein hydrolase activator NlpD